MVVASMSAGAAVTVAVFPVIARAIPTVMEMSAIATGIVTIPSEIIMVAEVVRMPFDNDIARRIEGREITATVTHAVGRTVRELRVSCWASREVRPFFMGRVLFITVKSSKLAIR